MGYALLFHAFPDTFEPCHVYDFHQEVLIDHYRQALKQDRRVFDKYNTVGFNGLDFRSDIGESLTVIVQ
jgi:hypothetical protein